MKRNGLNYAALGLLLALAIGNTADAETERVFFWSDSVPRPSCYEGKDGEGRVLGISESGKKRDEDDSKWIIPTCEEAKKTWVVVKVNGNYLQVVAGTNAEPYIENGRTMIPLRAVADAFGFEIEWEPNGQKITLTKEKKKIVMHVGKAEMSVDGQPALFEEAVPTIKNDHTFLPARQLAEILGIQVEWDEANRTATFTAPAAATSP
ncbi:copper amine oxidase N-terminal domain-containing protein [Paenibacillus flagellatus]|uniref:copper amine oxidase N-terminal domain-containing protein n=1 Tax=Paenibacillus flagellatus TaxID=2211139 RepID=UPI00130508DF|nr:copper amine oxidase N-terminal domain-containing protein [Paenibacillus flagellatus]